MLDLQPHNPETRQRLQDLLAFWDEGKKTAKSAQGDYPSPRKRGKTQNQTGKGSDHPHMRRPLSPAVMPTKLGSGLRGTCVPATTTEHESEVEIVDVSFFHFFTYRLTTSLRALHPQGPSPARKRCELAQPGSSGNPIALSDASDEEPSSPAPARRRKRFSGQSLTPRRLKRKGGNGEVIVIE